MEYTGNAIYDYIYDKNLDYYFSAEHDWTLVYGNAESIPKIMVFASKVPDIKSNCTDNELKAANKAFSVAKYLKLPFIFVRFMINNNLVRILEENVGKWQIVTYDELRDIYEKYGVVQPGTAKKPVNQYTSSSYHVWQRNNLGRITVSDLDLIKYNSGQVQEIIELKRSKIPLNRWTPYNNDYPNFALIINAIVGSGGKIPFTLYYNLMGSGERGMRAEDISLIKVYDFIIPKDMISSDRVEYRLRGYYKPDQLLK